MRQIVFGNPAARISNRKYDGILCIAHADGDRSALRCIAHCIINEDDENLLNTIRVGHCIRNRLG